jgi:hypothetical protein
MGVWSWVVHVLVAPAGRGLWVRADLLRVARHASCAVEVDVSHGELRIHVARVGRVLEVLDDVLVRVGGLRASLRAPGR